MIQMNGRRTRVAVIGLDGASLPLLERLAAEGVMPNIGHLLARGASGPLESVIPTNSIAAWSSFMTGQRPEQHRAFSFTVRDPRDFARKQIVNATFLRGQTLWDLLSRAGQSVGVYNVPLTYPARSVNGFMVTGLMTPSTEREFTYPADLTPALLGEVPGYMLDVGWMRYQGRPADLVRDLVTMTRQRVAALRFLLSRYDPDFAIAVFVSPDRIQHALWREIDPRHPDHDPAEAAVVMPHIHAFYRALDEAVGETMALLGSGYDLLVMSDHGFHRVARQVLLNEWLSQEGLLHWSSPGRRRVQQSLQAAKRYLRKRVGRQAAQRVRRVIRHRANVSDDTAIDWSRTAAYSTWETQQGISVNLQGREPEGIVPLADYERVVDDLVRRLEAWRAPGTGEPVMETVRRAEGDPLARTGADILLMPAAGFAFSRYGNRLYAPTGWASGGHALEGVLIADGPRFAPAARRDGAHIEDLAPTILHLLGQPVPSSMSGRVLEDWLRPEFVESHPVRFVEGGVEAEAAGVAYSSEDTAAVEERLRGLGYL